MNTADENFRPQCSWIPDQVRDDGGGLERPAATAGRRRIVVPIGRDILHVPLMVLDHARTDRPSRPVARRFEDETLLDQPAGRVVELRTAARTGDRAVRGAAVGLDRVDDRDGAAAMAFGRSARIVAVA